MNDMKYQHNVKCHYYQLCSKNPFYYSSIRIVPSHQQYNLQASVKNPTHHHKNTPETKNKIKT